MTEIIDNLIILKKAVYEAFEKTSNSAYHLHIRCKWEKEYEILKNDLIYYSRFVHNKLEKMYVINNKEYIAIREKYKNEWHDLFANAYSDSESETHSSEVHNNEELMFPLEC
jgi:zona occludens toxin (predicted ATPase)